MKPMRMIFNIALIRHEDGMWKFYPKSDLPPVCIKEELIPSVESLTCTALSSYKLILATENRLITYVGLDCYTLFDLSKKPESTPAPELPDAYKITGKECLKKLKHDDCCSCCPWCKRLTPSGFFRLDYPSECYRFTPR